MTLIPSNAPPLSAPTPAGLAAGARWRWAMLGIVLAALLLRAIPIDHDGFWYDEAITAAIAHSSFADIFHWRGVASDAGNPPLYWAVARAWYLLFGDSEIALRSFSVICGTLAVLFVGLVGRRLFGTGTGLLAAALLAISPLAIELSGEARTYALEAMLLGLSTWLLLRWLASGRTRDLVLYGAAMLPLLFTHYFAFFAPLAHGAAIIGQCRNRRQLLPWLVCIAALAVLWLFWLPFFLQQLHLGGNLNRMPGSWQFQYLATPVVLTLGRTFAWRDSHHWMLALALLGALAGFWIPIAWGAWRLLARPRSASMGQANRFAAILLLTWLLAPIVLPFFASLAGMRFYHTRAASVTLPAAVLLLAYGLVQLRPNLRNLSLATIGAFTLVSLVRYNTEPLRDDWRSTTPAVLARLGPGEPIAFDTDIEVMSFKYYVPRFGRMPREMYGLMQAPSDGRLMAVRWQDGAKVHRAERDYTHELLNSPGLWLILCVPNGTPEEYQSLLARHGFVGAQTLRFHRIEAIHYLKG